eukprot:1352487-Amorphochlora_amoeboformis.AAC.2
MMDLNPLPFVKASKNAATTAARDRFRIKLLVSSFISSDTASEKATAPKHAKKAPAFTAKLTSWTRWSTIIGFPGI